jgi:hypothetical protein
MQPLEAYRRAKLSRRDFRQLYARECHVCRHTLDLFGRMQAMGLSPAQLASAAGEDPAAVIALLDAEYCDPELMVRLARHLGVAAPPDCPRRTHRR